MKDSLRKFPRKWANWREGLRDRPAVDLGYRLTVGVVGGVVLIIGIIAIPYPGPGWAIVFLGLGILSTEFEFARKALHWVRHRYDKAMEWLGRQGMWVKVLAALFTCAVVLLTTWLLGALGFLGGLFGLDWAWLKSPIGLGS